MEHLELINVIRYESDNKAMSKGAKIFLADPSMYSVLSGQTGNIREALVATFFRQSRREIHACRNEKEGDFKTSSLILEVGGREKRLKNADFVVRDDLEVPGEKTIPLWSLGMMY